MKKATNVLEIREGLVDWTEYHLQEVQGIRPHVSGRSSDQSTQLGHLYHLDYHYCSGSQITTTPSSVDYVLTLCFYVDTMQRICLRFDNLVFSVVV
jgi:hypothetical protein